MSQPFLVTRPRSTVVWRQLTATEPVYKGRLEMQSVLKCQPCFRAGADGEGFWQGQKEHGVIGKP